MYCPVNSLGSWLTDIFVPHLSPPIATHYQDELKADIPKFKKQIADAQVANDLQMLKDQASLDQARAIASQPEIQVVRSLHLPDEYSSWVYPVIGGLAIIILFGSLKSKIL